PRARGLGAAPQGLATRQHRRAALRLDLGEEREGGRALLAAPVGKQGQGALGGGGEEAADLAAREYRRGQRAELGQDQDDHSTGGWLLERLEEGLRRRQRHRVGLVHDEYLHRRLDGSERGQTLELADTVHADRERALGIRLGRRGLDQVHVGMHAARDTLGGARRGRAAAAHEGGGERLRGGLAP